MLNYALRHKRVLDSHIIKVGTWWLFYTTHTS